MAVVSVEDLEARWRGLSGDERDRAGVLIEDAMSLVADECPRWSQADEATIRRVVCAVVKRAMQAPDDAMGAVQSGQVTAGPFQQQYTLANPSGDLYLTKAERRQLGCSGGHGAFEIDLLAGRS